MKTKIGIILFSVLLGAIRIWMGFNVEPHSASLTGVYQSVSHLFIGGLCVSWWRDGEDSSLKGFVSWIYGWKMKTIVALCLLEIAVAVLSRI